MVKPGQPPTPQAPLAGAVRASEPRIGLALGGGGARGIAHVHALEAMDELGLVPAAISGTSIGAIIGAGRAAGLSGREVRELLLDAFRDQGQVWSRLWQLRPKRFGDLFGGQGLVQFDPERVLDLFLPEVVSGEFAGLAIPLALSATDFYGCGEVTLTAGPLRRAIAASIALPILFRPVDVDGTILIDGGVTNPLPYDRLPRPCDLVVAVDVVGMPVHPRVRSIPTSWESVFGASQILMQTITAHKVGARPPDLLVRPPVDTFKVLDFLKVSPILKATQPVKDEIKRELDAAIGSFHRRRAGRPDRGDQ